MPSLIHEGKRYVLTKAAYQCFLCGTGFETKKNRGMSSCTCGAVKLYGGIQAGATTQGNPQHMRNVSTYQTEGPGKRERLPQEVLDKLHAEFVARCLETTVVSHANGQHGTTAQTGHEA